jgi:hypothetical protein
MPPRPDASRVFNKTACGFLGLERLTAMRRDRAVHCQGGASDLATRPPRRAAGCGRPASAEAAAEAAAEESAAEMTAIDALTSLERCVRLHPDRAAACTEQALARPAATLGSALVLRAACRAFREGQDARSAVHAGWQALSKYVDLLPNSAFPDESGG